MKIISAKEARQRGVILPKYTLEQINTMIELASPFTNELAVPVGSLSDEVKKSLTEAGYNLSWGFLFYINWQPKE